MGHGWVTPNPDGTRARCGGPALCPACARELLGSGKPARAARSGPPRGKGALPVAGRKAADVAAEVYPSKPQPSGTAPGPQDSPGS